MNQQDAIEKIKKLLRLSKSSNVNEAALAMANAQKIMDKHRIDISDISFEERTEREDNEPIRDYGYDDPLEKANDLQAWLIRLCVVVARANQTTLIMLRGSCGSKLSGMLRIIGRPSDVTATRYIYGFFKQEVLRLRDENCAGNSGKYKRHFCIGVVDAIAEKMAAAKSEAEREMKRQEAENPLALVRVNNAITRLERRRLEVEKWKEEKCGKMKKSHQVGGSQSLEGDYARSVGRKIGREQVRSVGKARASLGNSKKELN